MLVLLLEQSFRGPGGYSEGSFKKKLGRSRLKWASHVERMPDEKFAEVIRCPENGG